MQPLSLTLKGFRGIRDGLGRDALTLDFERIADGAELIAIAGANGRGKTTVMDNMHPYLTMPSRAAVAGPGGFSYYDHVFLPESEKDLIWAHEGRSYRSQVVIRLNGRRRTEAFLHLLGEDGRWQPVRLDDGTVSDGKVETYTRCVEALCGSADTFFTSVYSAQGKRQLSTYRNAEIKTLLADLLGQEEIRALGQKATDTVRLLKAGLTSIRQELAGLDLDRARLASERQRLANAPDRAEQAGLSRLQAQQAHEVARARHAALVAARDQSRTVDERRVQIVAERKSATEAGAQALDALKVQGRGEAQRLDRLEQRIATRRQQQGSRRQALLHARRKCLGTLDAERKVQRAVARQPLMERLQALREAQTGVCRQQVQRLAQCQAAARMAEQTLGSIEREAGKAALRAEELAHRFGLTGEVPCAGTDLQGQCKLLGDAREAQALIPSAKVQIARLADERTSAQRQLAALRGQCEALAAAPTTLAAAERRGRVTASHASSVNRLAARAAEMAQARATLTEVEQELAGLAQGGAQADAAETIEEHAERQQISTSQQENATQLARQSRQLNDALDRLDQALAALPAPFDDEQLSAAARALAQAGDAVSAAEQSHLAAVRDAQALEGMLQQGVALAARCSQVQTRIADVEDELGGWNLFAKCMSNDGLIALAIDDAGPALAGLANDLLLACYGSRFTVAIHTLIETGKGEQREGFDIVVHDGESGQSKSVGLMSGGERVWISCRDRHEIHYAENPNMPSLRSGRRPRRCNCAAGTCEATRHNAADSGTIGANSRGGTSLSLMSGGERTFIDACLTRAIALYLAQNTGRRFDTLFSDEADGPLDPEHKRMFMAMKREVLRLGGYRQEFFITQTPHLAAMADAIIDLDAMQVDALRDVALVAEEART